MDYCSSCRRHLNGALVCPGCGAYAPDIAPVVADGRLVSASATTASATSVTSVTTREAAVGAQPNRTLRSDAPEDLEGVPIAPEGRAARRRQRARWKKNQRRAVVATAVALVGGGLTVSAMDRQAGDRAQAATAPQDPGVDTVEEQSAHDARPASIPPHTRPSSSTPQDEQPTPDVPRRQSATVAPPTTPSNTQRGPASSTHTKPAPVSQSKSTSPASTQTALDRASGSDATAAPAEAPAASDSTGADTGTGTTGSETSQATTKLISTSPSEICVLVVCLPAS
ncbi:hypothetical protein ABZX98_14230 [Streptomyces sp. NPDC002992]|uniref:SCO2400 family protein n=1 Tax=Streptomyces sp. NPDC002992 TaxID=3154273 RepID=UPI0033B10911